MYVIYKTITQEIKKQAHQLTTRDMILISEHLDRWRPSTCRITVQSPERTAASSPQYRHRVSALGEKERERERERDRTISRYSYFV